MNDLKEISSSINRILNDIKAEVIVADTFEKGLKPSDVVVLFDGSFKRNYSNDVSFAEILKLENGQNLLGIHITRDGIYNDLPEAIFHDQSVEPLSSGHEMAKLSKHQKLEEKESRRFFVPFENEIFLQKVFLEMEERRILSRFSENLFDEIYPHFWNLDRTLPKKLISRFLLILHFAQRIVGNLDLTARCLEVILDEKASVRVIRQNQTMKKTSSQPIYTSSLGFSRVGYDFICGEYMPDYDPIMEFTIGPLKNSTMEDYLENGSYERFLNCYYDFFVPVEMDCITIVNVNSEDQQLILDDKVHRAILGYNTGI